MAVRPHKNMLDPNLPGNSPSLLAVRSAGERSCHELQLSTDAGRTWISAPRTLHGKTILAGFTPGQTVWLRHRPLTPPGEAAWSDPIALVIK
jgi:hypothetical protein